MYRSLLMFVIVLLSPLFLILLANAQDPYNVLLLTFGLGFAAVASGIGVLWHRLSKGSSLQTLLLPGGLSRASTRKGARVDLQGIEFGDFADNLEALVLLRCLANGQVVEKAYGTLQTSRTHYSKGRSEKCCVAIACNTPSNR